MKSTASIIIQYSKCLILLAAILGVYSTTASAQNELPFREYTNPDEIITFDRSTSFIEAIEIINQFAQEYEEKFIVDQSEYSGDIGVTLPAMHWKEALRYIIQFQNLELVPYEEYYLIRKPVRVSETGSAEIEGAPGQQGGTLPGAATILATKETREVRINATFFEGNRRALEEIGIDWSTLSSNVPANVADYVSSDGEEQLPETAFTDQFVSINSSNANQVSQNVFNALVNFGEVGPVSVQALFSAFESNNLGRTLATPSIKVMDGKQGRIQVGQDFSIKQRDFAGNVTDEFFSTGTILLVTPTVIEENDTTFIHLDLNVERSSASPDAVSTIINKQTAETETLLLNGEATAIAGLYQTDESTVRRGVPILKDLPGWFLGLRYIFGYNSHDYTENELVILIQAELEKSLTERIQEKLRTKNMVLESERDWFRNNMDYLIDESKATLPDISPAERRAADSLKVDDGRTKKMTPKTKTPEDTVPADTHTDDVADDSTATEDQTVTLTDEQRKQAEDLSMPVTNPELMVVVPKAFDLEEYLKKQENGEIKPVEEDKDLRFFVIGGSFIVPENAYRFEEILDSRGYEARILYNPSNRFNYVAFYGFSDFEEAVATTKRLQAELDPEIWLFTMQNDTRYKSDD